jgi:hypothetical protein
MARLFVLLLAVFSLHGIHRAMPSLPERIPSRFDFSGQIRGWEEPEMLWVLLAVQVGASLLILAIPALGRRAPGLVNLGWRRLSDYPPEARERVMPLLSDLCGWMAALFSFLFASIIRDLIRAGLDSTARPTPWSLPVFLVGMIAIVIDYVRRMDRAAKKSDAQAPEASLEGY